VHELASSSALTCLGVLEKLRAEDPESDPNAPPHDPNHTPRKIQLTVDTTRTLEHSSPTWQLIEGRLLAYESILSFLLNSYLVAVRDGTSNSHLHELSGKFLDRFLTTMERMLSYVLDAFPHPQFEVRRIAAMVLPQIAKILLWLDPNLISGGSGEQSVELYRAGISHARHVVEELAVREGDEGWLERFGSSHQGIADSEAAQTAGSIVGEAARKNEKACRGMVVRVLEVCRESWIGTLSRMNSASFASSMISISEIEVNILTHAFLGSKEQDGLLAAQICQLHQVAYGPFPALDLLHPLAPAAPNLLVMMPMTTSKESLRESPSNKQAGGDLLTTPKRAAYADRVLLASVLKFIGTFCSYIKAEQECR